MPYREHLEGLLKRAKRPERVAELEAELAVPPMPAGAVYLWNAFMRLSSRRGSSGWGPLMISWPEIDAFQRLSWVRLAPFEIEIIERLDEAWLGAVFA